VGIAEEGLKRVQPPFYEECLRFRFHDRFGFAAEVLG
jgi:hypothetical protein